ncbi:hypothetical protein INT48_000462 [Thamnidium elegans]|uniref:NADH:flavin oxidoreductase/NADH oxidase N-terminal domain-containing protein n=1 Tax=Thamnidium elegans TaxID=101142 RepID=A0A8H7SS31_9FUNG|nr:hypothetical protein INT48_000462 [Thamnidium elegans]
MEIVLDYILNNIISSYYDDKYPSPTSYKRTSACWYSARNRIIVSPMCMYSSEDSCITPEDAGIWSDTHIPALQQTTTLIKSQGSIPALQIGHAGRKASVYSPFHELPGLPLTKEFGGWPDQVVVPYTIALSEDYTVSKEMAEQDMNWASIFADKAGVEVLEIHNAYGYLIHSFLSGNSNIRTDQYGGSLENRMWFPLKIIHCVRDTCPQHKPLWVQLNKIGVDVIDVSSSGNLEIADYFAGPLYQIPLCQYIKKEANVTTSAVGVITEPKGVEEILQKDKADYILLVREFSRDSGWVFREACTGAMA